MDKLFGIIGAVLLFLLVLLLFLFIFLLLICVSHPKIIIKYKDKLEVAAKLWFFRFNITKLLSKKKKGKEPKIIHFDGNLFGEIPETENPKKKESHKKKNIKKQVIKSDEKEKKPVTPKISDAYELINEILDDIKAPFKKIFKVDIKRLYFTAASDDPHKTALVFGNMNTAAGTLIMVCKEFAALDIDENNVGVYSDFYGVKPSIDTHIVLTLSFRHVIICGFRAMKRFF